MSNNSTKPVENSYISPQCQYFVIRKKRLCRMTVKPGKHYCGEHEPQPKTGDGQDDTRIPCPNDPKHTCYASKLEKHLSICNARQLEPPNYIKHNVNCPAVNEDCPRLPLSKIPLLSILQVINKVNALYDTYLKDKIITLAEQAIHNAVLPEFSEVGRTESSLRHLRQASSLLRVVEREGLVADNTAYVELGAGKGHLSYYAWHAWCRASGSRVLLVDRASLRHKRDNKLKLASNPSADQLSSCSDNDRMCHSKHHPNKRTDELNLHNDKINSDLNNPKKLSENLHSTDDNVHRIRADLAHLLLELVPSVQACDRVVGFAKHLCGVATDLALGCITAAGVAAKVRGVVVASCCHHRCERAAYPANESLQKLGIDADDFNTLLGIVSWATCGDGRSRDRRNRDKNTQDTHRPDEDNTETHDIENPGRNKMKLHENDNPGINHTNPTQNTKSNDPIQISDQENRELNVNDSPENKAEINSTRYTQNKEILYTSDNSRKIVKSETELGTRNLELSQQQREVIGRRAKALLDWGRVLHLRDRGFDARLVHYVPTSVSLENVCIVATKLV